MFFVNIFRPEKIGKNIIILINELEAACCLECNDMSRCVAAENLFSK